MTGTRLLFVTPNFDNNSLGRTYCLWLLARELGWETRVVGIAGQSVWTPLQETDFAADCQLLASLSDQQRKAALEEAVGWSDVVLAVKTLPNSLGLAADAVRAVPKPLMVDIDDPDIEYRTSWQPLRRRVRARVEGRYQELMELGRLARTLPRFVSNPVLQDWYGGVVIPHAREEASAPSYSSSGPVTVRFVGSPRGHKGVDVLRRSVARLGAEDVRLEITAEAPADAKPWESWLGQTSFEVGQALVASADVIAIPSMAKSWAVAQLPAKLMDAMMMGRAVVASDVAPIRWALDGSGLLVPPGDVDALTAALRELCDAGRREALGRAAYSHALNTFGVRAIAPVFAAEVSAAIKAGPVASILTERTSPEKTLGTRITHRLAAKTSKGSPMTSPAATSLANTGQQELTGLSLVVAVLTFRRPKELAALLPELLRQSAECAEQTGLDVSVLVVDNDPEVSAREVVEVGPLLRYAHEATPGIAAGRNRALTDSADADLLVFIDDDEWPNEGWLRKLVETFADSGPAGVVGPVVSQFAVPPSKWVTAGRFFDRRRLPTGTQIQTAATNNLLLDLRQIRRLGVQFDVRFGLSGGSDTLFSHQLVSRGGRLVWCADAMVVDQVPASRVTAKWVLLRALRSGNSWSRTVLQPPISRLTLLQRRAVLTARGSVRLAGGLAMALSGIPVWSISRQARGLRTAARGAGMLSGAYGYVYSEYRRRDKKPTGA